MEMVIAGLLILSVHGQSVTKEFSYSFLTTECNAAHAEKSVNGLVQDISEMSFQQININDYEYTFRCVE